MALDAQQNWNVSMAENFDQVVGRGHAKKDRTRRHSLSKHLKDSLKIGPRAGTEEVIWNSPPVYLPDEIIILILNHIIHTSQPKEAQGSLAACCLLSRQWYSTAVPLLYRRPIVQPRTFAVFSRTICPSLNLHIKKSPLSEFVRALDMGCLVHHGSNSVTARMLGRTKQNLEEFVAPTATFGTSALPALARCYRLCSLDLSLVSQSPPLPDLLKTVMNLERLTRLRLPRSCGFEEGFDAAALPWPPNLENLVLSGRMDKDFFVRAIALPHSLSSLTIEYCPLAKGDWIVRFIRTSVRCLPRLKTLKLQNLRQVNPTALNGVLPLLPGLENLSISVDYINDEAFDIFDVFDHSTETLVPRPIDPDEFNLNASPLHAYPPTRRCRLRFLELTHSGSSDVEDKLSPWAIEAAVSRGLLRNLRQVRVAKSLRWNDDATVDATDDLSKEMKAAALAERSGDVADHREANVGVWQFEGQHSYLP